MKYLTPEERKAHGVDFVYPNEEPTAEQHKRWAQMTISERIENCFKMMELTVEEPDHDTDETGTEFLLKRTKDYKPKA